MVVRDLLQPTHLIILLLLIGVPALMITLVVRSSRPTLSASYHPPHSYANTTPPGMAPPSLPLQGTPSARLAEAQRMLNSGLISHDDFAALKRRILEEM